MNIELSYSEKYLLIVLKLFLQVRHLIKIQVIRIKNKLLSEEFFPL